VRTWSISSDVSEAQPLAVAVYNITLIGGLGYFLGNYEISIDVGIGTVLRFVGIALSGMVAVLIIMVPKLVTIMNIEFLKRMFGELLKRRSSDDSFSHNSPAISEKDSHKTFLKLALAWKPRSSRSARIMPTPPDL
jgi:hypothetical protein